ncbi:MAG TPA: helix-turn-helix transcriptional regulator [Verrucomicrobiae bacterium]|jgi:transcriptional regulator with XRE-family HTH domain|nr:helix-turn-helix transcriptional regulator [Verrucomicrobiae bacterium]
MAKLTDDFASALAKVIKRHRQQKGMSLAKLAELSGTTQTYPGRVEKGERTPTVTVADAFAKALGVPLSKLIAEAEKLQNKT